MAVAEWSREGIVGAGLMRRLRLGPFPPPRLRVGRVAGRSVAKPGRVGVVPQSLRRV